MEKQLTVVNSTAIQIEEEGEERWMRVSGAKAATTDCFISCFLSNSSVFLLVPLLLSALLTVRFSKAQSVFHFLFYLSLNA